MATPPQKFTFDTEFFELVPGSASSTAAAHLAQTQAEQKQQAYDEGYAAGLKEGQQQAQADLAVMQQHLQKTLAALQGGMAEREAQLLMQTLALLRTSLHHLVGDVLRHYPDELLEQHLRMVLPLVKTDESLTLRIHPQARGYHEKLGLPHAGIMGIPMHVVADASLGGTDAVVEWKNGGAESSLAQHLAQLARQLEAAGVPLLPTPPLPTAGPAPVRAAPATTPATATSPAEATPTPSTPAPQTATPPPPPASALEEAGQTTRSRAAELLGDDDLVDALKS